MKPRILLFLYISTCIVFSSQAQVGKAFPDMACVDLDDTTVSLPSALIGKKSVLCLAYSQKSQEKLEEWVSKAIPKFVLRSSDNSLFPLEPYDVHTYFIAMYTGVNKAVAKKATEQIKTNVDVLLHPYVLTYTGELDTYKKSLKMVNKDDPYIFVLDEKGNIEYMYSGVYSEKVMGDIEDLISEE